MGPDTPLEKLARLFSTVGHPALILPAVILFQTAKQASNAPFWSTLPIILTALLIPGFIGFYSLAQVRQGNWVHIDASKPHERIKLNALLATVLFASSLISGMLGLAHMLTQGLLITGIIVTLALILGRWVKVSLHSCFSAFAAFLFWPDLRFLLAMLFFSLAIGWSRLALKRHTPLEVVLGLGIGALAGCAYIGLPYL